MQSFGIFKNNLRLTLIRKNKLQYQTIQTNRFQETKDFYAKTLGIEINEETSDVFSVRIGWSILRFQKSIDSCLYHYCFLIPSNSLEKALVWMGKRMDIIEVEDGEKIVNFEEWNADSFYFYDGSGNIAELIVHYDLDNSIKQEFDFSAVLGISEIGIGTNDVESTNSFLEENCHTDFWKGDLIRFGTNGSAEGKFLIANYNKKEIWFPTQIKIKPVPFEVEIENRNKVYRLEYIDGNLRKV